VFSGLNGRLLYGDVSFSLGFAVGARLRFECNHVRRPVGPEQLSIELLYPVIVNKYRAEGVETCCFRLCRRCGHLRKEVFVNAIGLQVSNLNLQRRNSLPQTQNPRPAWDR